MVVCRNPALADQPFGFIRVGNNTQRAARQQKIRQRCFLWRCRDPSKTFGFYNPVQKHEQKMQNLQKIVQIQVAAADSDVSFSYYLTTVSSGLFLRC